MPRPHLAQDPALTLQERVQHIIDLLIAVPGDHQLVGCHIRDKQLLQCCPRIPSRVHLQLSSHHPGGFVNLPNVSGFMVHGGQFIAKRPLLFVPAPQETLLVCESLESAGLVEGELAHVVESTACTDNRMWPLSPDRLYGVLRRLGPSRARPIGEGLRRRQQHALCAQPCNRCGHPRRRDRPLSQTREGVPRGQKDRRNHYSE